MFKQILIGSLVLLGACSTQTTTPETVSEYQKISFEGEKATAAERAACEAVGGLVRRAGMAGYEHCIQDMADSGKVCSDTSDCVARCIIPPQEGRNYQPGEKATGVCAPTDEIFGCITKVSNGMVEPTLCID